MTSGRKYQFDRHFTLEEANALLPDVRAAFREVEDIRRRLALSGEELERLTRKGGSNGGGPHTAEYLDGILQLNSVINGLSRHGILIKDINIGLVDFPHLRDGEEVFLCYRMGEDSIGWWHDLESGFMGRRSLEEL